MVGRLYLLLLVRILPITSSQCRLPNPFSIDERRLCSLYLGVPYVCDTDALVSRTAAEALERVIFASSQARKLFTSCNSRLSNSDSTTLNIGIGFRRWLYAQISGHLFHRRCKIDEPTSDVLTAPTVGQLVADASLKHWTKANANCGTDVFLMSVERWKNVHHSDRVPDDEIGDVRAKIGDEAYPMFFVAVSEKAERLIGSSILAELRRLLNAENVDVPWKVSEALPASLKRVGWFFAAVANASKLKRDSDEVDERKDFFLFDDIRLTNAHWQASPSGVSPFSIGDGRSTVAGVRKTSHFAEIPQWALALFVVSFVLIIGCTMLGMRLNRSDLRNRNSANRKATAASALRSANDRFRKTTVDKADGDVDKMRKGPLLFKQFSKFKNIPQPNANFV